MNASLSREDYEQQFVAQSEKLRRMAFLFLHEPAAVEDVIQDAFTLGLAHLHTFRAESRFDVWLYSIALNVCRQACRRARLEKKYVEAPHPVRKSRSPL